MVPASDIGRGDERHQFGICLLYTSDAADERSSVDLGGRRIIKKKNYDGTRDGAAEAKHFTYQHSTKQNTGDRDGKKM